MQTRCQFFIYATNGIECVNAVWNVVPARCEC